MTDPYETLQVLRTAHIEVIRAAYRALYREATRIADGAEREARMRAAVEAGELIGTEAKRKAYDAQVRQAGGSQFKPGRVEDELLGALLVIVDSLLEMDGAIGADTLRDGMFADGYTNLDFLLASKALVEKGLAEKVRDTNSDSPAYRLTDDAWSWIEAKRSTFPPRRSVNRALAGPTTSTGNLNGDHEDAIVSSSAASG